MIHFDNRIKSYHNAYYAPQGIGLSTKGSSTDIMAYVWNTAIRPILTYGMQCVDMNVINAL